MKFVMTQAVCKEGMDMLKNQAEVYVADRTDADNYLDEIKDADALIVRIAKCSANTIENARNLRVIGRTGVGYDTVDVRKATEKGIPVVITPGANNRSVAEHTVAMMLSLAKNLYESESEMRKGNWEIRGAGKAFELCGKTAGFIGLGAIGTETLKLCKALGMKTAGYDPFLSREQIEELGAEYYGDYRKMAAECDVLSLHVPLTESTRNMITAKEIASMKKTALLINCSRGGIVNENDLADALKGGEIAGAALDVFCEEPMKATDLLMSVPNLLLTPHSAAQTREATIRMAVMCVKGCLAVLDGKRWPYVANPEVYETTAWRKWERKPVK